MAGPTRMAIALPRGVSQRLADTCLQLTPSRPRSMSQPGPHPVSMQPGSPSWHIATAGGGVPSFSRSTSWPGFPTFDPIVTPDALAMHPVMPAATSSAVIPPTATRHVRPAAPLLLARCVMLGIWCPSRPGQGHPKHASALAYGTIAASSVATAQKLR